MKQIHHLIDAETVKSSSGRNSAVFNPATGEQTGQLDLASVQEVDAAVASSHAAFEEWQHVSIAKRAKLMFAFRNLVDANADEIARRLTSEHGKVLSDAMGEVARGIENIEFACGLAEQLKGSYSENASTGVDVYTVRRPLGVVAGITPFNFPAMVPLWMIPNAVACGNTFILKPSERDPSSPMFIVELFQEAGFPPGVLNLVNGDKVAVDGLPGDEEPHDLARALEDPVDPEVPHPLLDRLRLLAPGAQRVGGLVTATPLDLQRLVDQPPARFRAEELGEGRLQPDVVAASIRWIASATSTSSTPTSWGAISVSSARLPMNWFRSGLK